MIDRRKVLRVVIHAAYLLVVYIFQACIFTWMPLFGFVPLLLPVAVAGIAMTEGITAGGIFGIFAGMLCDVAFNEPTVIYTVTLTVVGLGVGYLMDTVLSKSFVSYLVTSAAVLIVVSAVQGFSFVFFHGQPFGSVLLCTLFQTVYSLVFSIPMYFAARSLGRSALNA